MKIKLLLFTRMRLIAAIAVLCAMSAIPITAHAQKVSLKLQNTTVQQAILALRQQGYSISVKANDVDMSASVSINAENADLQSVVDEIFKGQNVQCTVNGKSILVSKKVAKNTEKQSQVHIQGRVNDASGKPLMGVTVWIEGTTIGTTTDSEGVYRIDARPGDMLVFSYIGYDEIKEPVGQRSNIDISMKETPLFMDEVVVVGYGTQSRRTLTTAISKIDGSEISNAPVTSIGDALKGKVSGMRVASNNTIAGESPRFLIRGGSSITLSNDPIVIVDGITRDMADINPNDIESIEVLKDAASAGIYGARASNGVILITTKKGSAHQGPEIVFEGQVGWESPSRKWNLMNSREFISFVRPAIAEGPNALTVLSGANAAGTGNISPGSTFTTRYLNPGEEVPAGYQWMNDPLDPSKVIIFTDRNYQNDWFGNALWHKEYVGVNGGNDKLRYAASASYMSDGGMVAMSDYSVFTMHGNTSFKITKNLEASTTFDLSRSKKHPLINNYFNAIGRGIMMAPTHRDYDDQGNMVTGGTNVNQQTAAYYEKYFDREMAYSRMTGNFNLKWTIIDGLTATAQYAINDVNYRGSYYAYASYISSTRSTTETRTETLRDNFTAYLNYNKTFKDMHHVDITAGYDYMMQHYWYLTANSTGSSSDKVPILDSGVNFTASNKDTRECLISYFGRASYDYGGRYIFSATVRADGSSKFAKGNQWGYFPAGSAAWVISEEPFWNVSSSKINTLKLRVSYGQTGNNGIGLYDAYGAFDTGNIYNGQSTILPSAMQNKDLKWETTTQLDVGLDFGMFNDRLRLVVDYYNKRTDNMLMSITLPDTGSLGSMKANVGSVRFYGFEVELSSVNIQKKNFTWTTDITYSYNRNRVLSLPDEYKYTDINGKDAWRIGGYTMSESGYRFGGTAVGEELGRIYGYKISHIIQSQAEADAALYDTQSHGYRRSDGQSIAGRKDIGDYEWCNREGSSLTADGKEQIDAEDMFLLGNVMPHSVGGILNTFRYKRLTLSVYFDFALGHSVYNYMKSRFFQNTLGNCNSNLDKMVYDCWRYPGDTDAKYARFFPNDPDYGNRNFSRISDFNVERGDYLCLRDVSIFYDLPEKWVRKLGMKKLTVGITGNTLFYWTAVSGSISPETGMGTGADDSMYSVVSTGASANSSIAPATRKVLFNLKITF